MINVVYLVIIFSSYSDHSVTVPQANMKQCDGNALVLKRNDTGNRIEKMYCISGVK